MHLIWLDWFNGFAFEFSMASQVNYEVDYRRGEKGNDQQNTPVVAEANVYK